MLSLSQATTSCYKYEGCQAHTEFCIIDALGHEWPGHKRPDGTSPDQPSTNIDATAYIFERCVLTLVPVEHTESTVQGTALSPVQHTKSRVQRYPRCSIPSLEYNAIRQQLGTEKLAIFRTSLELFANRLLSFSR